MKRKLALAKTASPPPTRNVQKGLLLDVRELIVNARQSVATTVNAALTLLHWQIGKRIREDILKEQRGGYGEEIVATLSQQLETEFGRGFGQRNLFRMVRFAEVFPDPKIVTSLMTQLGWTHFLHLIRFDDPLKRDFYAEMCRIERWSIEPNILLSVLQTQSASVARNSAGNVFNRSVEPGFLAAWVQFSPKIRDPLFKCIYFTANLINVAACAQVL